MTNTPDPRLVALQKDYYETFPFPADRQGRRGWWQDLAEIYADAADDGIRGAQFYLSHARNMSRLYLPAVVPENATGTPKASVPFRATLTHTGNKYLVDRLPVEGYVDIVERDNRGRVSRVVFMPDVAPGEHTSYVSVPSARFEFSARL